MKTFLAILPIAVLLVTMQAGAFMVYIGWAHIGLAVPQWESSYGWWRVLVGQGNYWWGFGGGFIIASCIYQRKSTNT